MECVNIYILKYRIIVDVDYSIFKKYNLLDEFRKLNKRFWDKNSKKWSFDKTELDRLIELFESLVQNRPAAKL